MSRKKIILPIVVVLIAVAMAVVLVKLRQPPQQHEEPFLGPLTEFVEAVSIDRQVQVRGTGTVEPRNEIRIIPQVSGKVVEIAPQLIVGGFFHKGEQLLAIEDADYRLAIELARASLAQAELELARTRNLAEVARGEWQRLGGRDGAAPDPLVVYEPQLINARAQRDAAEAAIAQAELNLKRTRIHAPFNGFVRSEQVDLGQFLGMGAPVATITGTDLVEIVVPVPLEDLAWLEVPRRGETTSGATAEVKLKTGGHISRWKGEVVRVLGDIDPLSRMARVVITVEDPYAAKQEKGDLLDQLRPGMFVEVEMLGRTQKGAIVIPRGALRDNETVWVVDDDNRLRIRKVETLRRERDEILLHAGLAVGEKVIITNLSGAADGMLLRPHMQGAAR